MYYEVYIDVLFLVNFMMDYIVLLTTKRILKCTATQFRMLLAGGIGALLTCIVICFPEIPSVIRYILFYFVINAIMIQTGFGFRKARKFVEAYAVLYVSSILLGGVMGLFRPYLRTVSLFFLLAVVSYQLIRGCLKLLEYLQRLKSYRCKVTMYFNGVVCDAEAIIDTGNSLRDPDSGIPVNLVARSFAKQFWGSQKLTGVKYVKYHTVGRAEGMIPVILIDRMCIHREQDQWVIRPLIGICTEEISVNGESRMILNPDIL